MQVQEIATILQANGIRCHAEPFDGSIRIEDDGAFWYWGTVNATWNADIMRNPAVGDMFGHAVTDVPSDCEDAGRIASAILATVQTLDGVTFWR